MDDREVVDNQVLRIFEDNERRSETYGITNASAAPLRERNSTAIVESLPLVVSERRMTERKHQLAVARATRTTVQTAKVNMGSKENVDMAFEIDVPTGVDVQVQIEVKDDDGNIIGHSPLRRISSPLTTHRRSAMENHSTSVHRIELHSAQHIIDNRKIGIPTSSAVSASSSPAKKNESGKQLTWHKSVIDALESHEFRRRDTHTSKAMSTRKLNNDRDRNTSTTSSESDVAIEKGLVAGRAAIFERGNGHPDKRQQKDPAELSMQERLALFEKNKGAALVPIAAFAMAPSSKQIAKNSLHQIIQNQSCDQEANMLLDLLDCDKQQYLTKSNLTHPIPSATPIDADHTVNVLRKRHSDENLNMSQSVRDAIEDVKRVKINPPKIGSIYPSLSDADSDDVKPAENETSVDGTVSFSVNDNELDAKFDLSGTDDDADLNSSQQANDDSEDDFSGHIYTDSDTQSPDGDCTGIDEYLDEALENDDDCAKLHDKRELDVSGSVTSNSFTYEKPTSQATRQQTIVEEKSPALNSTSSVQSVSDLYSNISIQSGPKAVHPTSMPPVKLSPLAYSVDSYRRQQLKSATPVLGKVVIDNDDESENSTDSEDCDDRNQADDDHIQSQVELVAAKIKKLLAHADIQHQQIIQASNALNTCASLFAFTGSSESVVAEWKLLVATHSRLAAQNEVTRLRTERYLRPAGAPTECGQLIIKEITFPLKQDFVTKMENDQIAGNHLVCLLKYNEQVVATKTISTRKGLMSTQFHDILRMENVFVDFKTTLEVYGMAVEHEVLPHEVKYRIQNKKGIIKTPKGKIKISKEKPGADMTMPVLKSSAEMNAVRTPKFAMYGFVTFSLRDAKRTSWTLDLVPGVPSPLFGNVYMKMNYEFSVNIDHRGFLTMFEDVSGFGAWHRRWCRLHGCNSKNVVLSYWKYPDDEPRKPPIGNLDLKACEQRVIAIAPRDVCARLNTMLIELKRPKREDDQDSLLLVTKEDHTVVRHLLSADTKEERNEWIAHFTKALALMRGWVPNAN